MYMDGNGMAGHAALRIYTVAQPEVCHKPLHVSEGGLQPTDDLTPGSG